MPQFQGENTHPLEALAHAMVLVAQNHDAVLPTFVLRACVCGRCFLAAGTQTGQGPQQARVRADGVREMAARERPDVQP